VALQGVTGVPVSVGEKERGFIPVGVTTAVAKDSDEAKPASVVPAATALPAGTADAIGTVSVATTPDGADVYVDNQFYGNSPATLKLKPGKHTVTVKMSGYKDWTRDVSTDAGSEAHLTAKLEK
jgi:hypothetical protein